MPRFFLYRTRPAPNERTGTTYNHLQYPTDLVLLVALWRLRYKLSLRDLAEMFLARGFTFTHETVRDWEARFAPLLADRLRATRRGQGGRKWHANETYLRVDGRGRATGRPGGQSTFLGRPRSPGDDFAISEHVGIRRQCHRDIWRAGTEYFHRPGIRECGSGHREGFCSAGTVQGAVAL